MEKIRRFNEPQEAANLFAEVAQVGAVHRTAQAIEVNLPYPPGDTHHYDLDKLIRFSPDSAPLNGSESGKNFPARFFAPSGPAHRRINVAADRIFPSPQSRQTRQTVSYVAANLRQKENVMKAVIGNEHHCKGEKV
jgi:hypothetical protein